MKKIKKKLQAAKDLSSPQSLFSEEWHRQQTTSPENEDLIQRTARHQHPTVQESVVEKILTKLKLQYLPQWVFRTKNESFIFDFLIKPNLVLECTLTARKGCAESKAWLKDRSTIFERKFKELKRYRPQCFTVIFLEATSCRPEDLRAGIPTLQYTDLLITCLEEFETFLTQWKRSHAKAERLASNSPQHPSQESQVELLTLSRRKIPGPQMSHSFVVRHGRKDTYSAVWTRPLSRGLSCNKERKIRLRAQYYTPMAKPLGVNVPGSPTSTIPGSAPLLIETRSENPFAALAKKITTETLGKLPVKALRVLLEGIQIVSGNKVSKSGKKAVLIQRILTSPHRELAVHRFLADKDVQDQRKQERLNVKLFTSLRGALRRAGTEILRDLHLPYSVQALPEDQLPEGAHRPGECPDPENECLLCQVFGSLHHESIFKNYTPPLVNDPEHKLDMSQEVNHVLIRTHARNVLRPDGNTLNFNQQYFAGEFITYLQFPNGLPDPLVLGFLVNCLEQCADVGAAKAWGAGKLFLQSYTLEKVDITYEREWDGEAYQLIRKETVTTLKTELDQAFGVYTQWIAQQKAIIQETDEGEAVA
ncbi:MAG: hypothetical protein ACE5I5_00015 [Candidatus Heimdallarchaeota archaeon]